MEFDFFFELDTEINTYNITQIKSFLGDIYII